MSSHRAALFVKIGDIMAKTKRRSRKTGKTTEKLKITMKFELSGLILLVLSVIALAKLGPVGNILVFFSCFFMGAWYIIFWLGIMTLAFYFIIKRRIPEFSNRKFVGIYFIVASILLLSHIPIFNLALEGAPIVKSSIIITYMGIII